MLREGRLPENVTPENSKLEDPEERHRIAKVFEQRKPRELEMAKEDTPGDERD